MVTPTAMEVLGMGLAFTYLTGALIYLWFFFVEDLSGTEAFIKTLWPGSLIATAVGLWIQKLDDEGRIY